MNYQATTIMSATLTPSTMFNPTSFDEDSTIAYLRNKWCAAPYVVSSFRTYSAIREDAIHQTQLKGRLVKEHLAEVKHLVEAKGIEADAERFKELGGTLVISPPMERVQASGGFKVHIRPDDLIIPICHEGMNRSQILHIVALALKSQVGKCNVSKPHGAESGFDPYQAYTGLDSENFYGYIHGKISTLAEADKMRDWLHKCFYQAFGVEKSLRIGHIENQLGNYMLNPLENDSSDEMFLKLSEGRTAQRKIMDNLMYDSDVLNAHTRSDGRVIVFTFCRATSIYIHRLLEVSGDKDLSNIVVVCLPYPDVISRAGGESDRAKYFVDHREHITRDALNVIKQKEVFAFYASLLQLVYLE